MASARQQQQRGTRTAAGEAIHYPARNGPVCGASPAREPALRHASAYSVDPEKLTCETCAAYIARLQRDSDALARGDG